mmetsp:Transcript_115804/g.373938  ORF Transcript_115804/g.373938 Transcript_115804/m.373938 type:complete len:127 (-) Transcript_115804:42-422(-)
MAGVGSGHVLCQLWPLKKAAIDFLGGPLIHLVLSVVEFNFVRMVLRSERAASAALGAARFGETLTLEKSPRAQFFVRVQETIPFQGLSLVKHFWPRCSQFCRDEVLSGGNNNNNNNPLPSTEGSLN